MKKNESLFFCSNIPLSLRSTTMIRSARPLGGQACCAIATWTPPVNCGIECLQGHRHALDYNTGRFLGQLQTHFFNVHKIQYPILLFHADLTIDQKRILRRKTRSAVLYYKTRLTPMALPLPLRPMFARIVNATKEAHPNGDLFKPERADAPYKGFWERMLSRFFAGEMLLFHPSVRGYRYVLKLDSVYGRIRGPFPYDPFARASALKLAFAYTSTVSEHATTLVNPVVSSWMREHRVSMPLLRPFVAAAAPDGPDGSSGPSVSSSPPLFAYNGMAYGEGFQLFSLDFFKSSTLYASLYNQVDGKALFLLGTDNDDTVLSHNQFWALVLPFVASSDSDSKRVSRLADVPISHPVDVNTLY